MSIVYAKTEQEADKLFETNKNWRYCCHERHNECMAVGHVDAMKMDPTDSLSDYICPRHAEGHHVDSKEWYRLEENGKIK